MKLQHTSVCLGLLAGAVLLGSGVPAQAASVSAASLGLPLYNPAQPVTNGQTASNPSLFPYKTSAFTPTKTFAVNFSVLGSRGQNFTNFGVLVNGAFNALFTEHGSGFDAGSNAKKNDWLGTCTGGTISPCQATYTFKAGTTYQLALAGPGLYTYGLGAIGSYTFNAISDQFYPGGPLITVDDENALFIGMEDGTFSIGKDKPKFFYDYQDYVVKATAVPEPATLAGLAVSGGALALLRRRKAAQSAKA